MANESISVGWIGAGKMGAPMAAHIVGAGHDLTVLDARPEACEELVGLGAKLADRIQGLGEACEIVFSSIPDDKVLIALVEGDDGAPGLADTMMPGSVLVETSTVSPEASDQVANALAARDIRYVCAPVSGSTAVAKAAKLTVLASGDKSGFDDALPLISRYSSRQFWLGEGGSARYMKLVLNTMVGATASILGEALALGEKGGLSRAAMMEVILESVVASPLIGYKKETVVNHDLTPAFRLDQMVKDFSLIISAAQRERIELEVCDLILRQYQRASASGRADQDFFALVDWLEEAGQAGAG